MKRILRIFRKDVRHLWPKAMLFWVLLGVAAAIDPLPDNRHAGSFLHQLPLLLQPLACWLLAVGAIHEEELIGHQQYWLARPFSWKHLIAAKGMFLLVFVNLPLLVCQLATLAALGIPPLAWLPALLWRQVFFTIFLILPAAAAAAVTRNLGQVLLAGILLSVTLSAGFGFSMLFRGRWVDWGGLGWIRECGTALVVAAGTVMALALQYSWRKTALARAALAGTVVLTMLVMTAPRWGGAFAIQRQFSRERIRDTAVRISFDESRASTRPMLWATRGSDPTGVQLEIPMRVDDVPQGAMVGVDWTSVNLRSAHGTWRSGWLTFPALHDLSRGAAWLTVYVDPEFYQASPDAAVELDGTVDLTLSRRVRTMEVGAGQRLVPEIGICRFETVLRPSTCYSPYQRVSFELAWASPAIPEQTPRNGPYAPFPTSAGFRPLGAASLSFGRGPGEYGTLSLVMDRPVAHVQRDFKVRGLRMSQFKRPER